ncbi:MAG: hypothetical protein D3923_12855, partial [Candidatus Electrothrix sp. AR3]|nr:hypothetical protein [Candidatus Electrothrix sp. AR3]
MSTLMSRMLLLACMTFSLAFFSGCGSKPVEPYQQKTGVNKPEAKDNSFYDYDGYATEATPATPASNSSSSSFTTTGENIDALLDNLPESHESRSNTETEGSIVEPLDAGSGLGEVIPAFGQKQNDDYKKKNGRSSPQMKSVYYNFDQSIIRNDQIPKMEANAQYLKGNPVSNV